MFLHHSVERSSNGRFRAGGKVSQATDVGTKRAFAAGATWSIPDDGFGQEVTFAKSRQPNPDHGATGPELLFAQITIAAAQLPISGLSRDLAASSRSPKSGVWAFRQLAARSACQARSDEYPQFLTIIAPPIGHRGGRQSRHLPQIRVSATLRIPPCIFKKYR